MGVVVISVKISVKFAQNFIANCMISLFGVLLDSLFAIINKFAFCYKLVLVITLFLSSKNRLTTFFLWKLESFTDYYIFLVKEEKN